jgi:hypothetical protein
MAITYRRMPQRYFHYDYYNHVVKSESTRNYAVSSAARHHGFTVCSD